MVYFYFRLAAAQAELDATMATLHEKQAKLADVEAQVCFSFILVLADLTVSKRPETS